MTWDTPVGEDCIDLCTSLPRWLGERLTFLGNHSSHCPLSYLAASGGDDEHAYGSWLHDLKLHGAALTRATTPGVDALLLTDEEIDATAKGAQDALRWVADNLQSLWD